MEHKGAVDFEMNFLRKITAGGAAVVAIDHTPKNTEHASVFGAEHKKAAVTGAMFRFEIARPFGRGLRGVSPSSTWKRTSPATCASTPRPRA